MATAREMCAPDVVAHLEGMPDAGIEGFLEFHRELHEGFSDLRVEIVEATSSNDTVVVHWHLTGRHTGPFLGVPPSGRSVDEWGMTKFKVVDGLFVEGWDSWNLNAFVEDLAGPEIEQPADRTPALGSMKWRGRPEKRNGDRREEASPAAALAVRWFDEIWNDRRTETIEELWGESVVGHMEGMPPLTKQDFLAFHAELTGAFSDLRIEILEVLTKGGQASIEWCLTGTHDGSLYGIRPTGRTVEEHGMTRLVFEGGKMVDGRDHWNLGGMLERLARPSVEHVAREHGLTERQAEVALLLAERLSAKEIAKRLGIAVNTARRHTQMVLRRLGVHDRAAVSEAIGRVRISLVGAQPQRPGD